MKVFGQQLQLCELQIGDDTGPKQPCFNVAAMPIRINGAKVQCCREHADLLKYLRDRPLHTTVQSEGAD